MLQFGVETLEDRWDITDDEHDILSHTGRGNRIHVLTLDKALADDVCERIHSDPRMKFCKLIRLRHLYKKRMAEQFPNHTDQLKAWLSRKGIRLANEKLHLYPLYFEDWVHKLMLKAAEG